MKTKVNAELENFLLFVSFRFIKCNLFLKVSNAYD